MSLATSVCHKLIKTLAKTHLHDITTRQRKSLAHTHAVHMQKYRNSYQKSGLLGVLHNNDQCTNYLAIKQTNKLRTSFQKYSSKLTKHPLSISPFPVTKFHEPNNTTATRACRHLITL